MGGVPNKGGRMKAFFRMGAPLSIFLVVAILFSAGRVGAQTAPGPIRVEVDETRAPQKIMHTHLQMPVQPGPLVLYYPEWIPGEHMPDGPIINMAGLKFTAGGKPIRMAARPAGHVRFSSRYSAGREFARHQL